MRRLLRRRWAVVRYYCHKHPVEQSRHWTRWGAQRAIRGHKARCPRIFKPDHTWSVQLALEPTPRSDKRLITI